jgi:mRNA interferase RelE/StbE
MRYTIIIERSAKKQLDKIPSPFFEAIDKKILALETNPRPPGCKKLKERSGWRIRVADYRIIYKINDNILQIIVINVDNRKQVYR